MDSSFHQLLRNLTASFVSKLFLRILGFVVLVLQAGHLGPEPFGVFVLIVSYVGILLTFVDLGWSAVIVREVGRDPSQASRYLANYLAFECFTSPLFAAALVLFAWTAGYAPDQMRLIAAATFGILFGGLYKAPAGVLIARQRADAVALVETGANLAASVAALMAVWAGSGLVVFVWIYNLYYAALFLGSLWMARTLLGPLGWRIEAGLWRAALAQGLICALISGGYALYTTLDVVMLSRLGSAEAMGNYGVAVRLVLPLMLFVESVMLGVFPLQAARQADPNSFRFLLNKAIKALAAVGLPIALGLSILAPLAIGALFPTYTGAAGPLSLLVWRLPILFVCAPINYALLVGGRFKTLAGLNGGAAALNIALCAILIPRWGATGAAAASLLCNAAVLAFYLAGRRRFYAFGISVADALRLAAALAAMVVALKTLGSLPALGEGLPALLALISVGAVVHLGALLALGYLGREERPYIEREWRRFRQKRGGGQATPED